MGEGTTLACVVCIIGHGQSCDAGQRLDRADMDGVFVEVGVAGAVPVYIFPRLD